MYCGVADGIVSRGLVKREVEDNHSHHFFSLFCRIFSHGVTVGGDYQVHPQSVIQTVRVIRVDRTSALVLNTDNGSVSSPTGRVAEHLLPYSVTKSKAWSRWLFCCHITSRLLLRAFLPMLHERKMNVTAACHQIFRCMFKCLRSFERLSCTTHQSTCTCTNGCVWSVPAAQHGDPITLSARDRPIFSPSLVPCVALCEHFIRSLFVGLK